jgi:hypothetical protein
MYQGLRADLGLFLPSDGIAQTFSSHGLGQTNFWRRRSFLARAHLAPQRSNRTEGLAEVGHPIWVAPLDLFKDPFRLEHLRRPGPDLPRE